jgi:monoamine oxidase
MGATWVSKRHGAIRALAKRMGCSFVPQFHDGRNVLLMSGRRRTYKSTIPKLGPAALIDVARIQAALDKLSRTIDLDAPWESPNAAELDAISFNEWLNKKRVLYPTRSMMSVVSKVYWGAAPSDVSLLHVLYYIKAGEGLDHMLDVVDGQQEERIVESTQEIAVRLAARLGERVVVNAPVRGVTQDHDGVTVRTDSATYGAAYVISATAPAHRADIAFAPALPVEAEGLARTWRMGALSKAYVAYDKPFWREDGLSGEALTDTGSVFITFDLSTSADGPGIMLAFCDPNTFDGFDIETRRRRVLAQLVELYGEKAARPIDYVDHCWGTESFAPGGPNPAVAPFATTTYARALTEPHGRVHWAGSETAGAWAGCMNGAVLSGQRAAEAVAMLLASTQPQRKEAHS